LAAVIPATINMCASILKIYRSEAKCLLPYLLYSRNFHLDAEDVSSRDWGVLKLD
jgi:hypothetical protein